MIVIIGVDRMLYELLLFILALLPVILLGYVIYSKDKEKEPIKLLIKLFLGGILSAGLTLGVSYLLNSYLTSFSYYPEMKGLSLFIYTFFFVSLVEELSKFIATYFISYHNKEYDQFYDMIVYAVFISLGFAWIENLLYVYEGGFKIALLRGLVAVPTHVSVAVFMGYYLSLAKVAELNHYSSKIKYLLFSILVPTILHGIYDYLIYSSNYFCIYLYYLFILILYKRAYQQVKVSSLMRQNLIFHSFQKGSRKKKKQSN